MIHENAVQRMAAMLKELRLEHRISKRQLADHAGVNVSVVSRAESGQDALLSTWERLLAGLGYRLVLDSTELAEDIPDLLIEERERRHQRRLEGLCAGKWRFF